MLHTFCEQNNRCGVDEEEVQVQILLHRNEDKTTPNTPDEIYPNKIYTRKFAGQLQHLRNDILYACSY